MKPFTWKEVRIYLFDLVGWEKGRLWNLLGGVKREMVEVEKEIENCNFKKNFADNELNYQVMRKVQCGVLRLN